MNVTRKEEARALDADERELVAATHHPEIQRLSDEALAALVSRVRDRRDRARDIAKQRRREMRGKGAARGAEPSRADAGSQLKAEVLAHALRRVNAEAERRRRMQAQLDMIESQRRALAMKEGMDRHHDGFNIRTAREGMRGIPSTRRRKIGSAREAGRVSQFVRNAQAKRDGR